MLNLMIIPDSDPNQASRLSYLVLGHKLVPKLTGHSEGLVQVGMLIVVRIMELLNDALL